jgi:hypothetical protein
MVIFRRRQQKNFVAFGGIVMVNLKLKGAVVAEFGSQAAAAKTLKAAGCSGLTERRLSRLIHGYDAPRLEEVRIIRERLGVELKLELVEAST